MSELERLVVLIARQLASTDPEIVALLETIDARCETARDYHKTRRGVHALERATARAEEREPNYAGAIAAAGPLKPGEL